MTTTAASAGRQAGLPPRLRACQQARAAARNDDDDEDDTTTRTTALGPKAAEMTTTAASAGPRASPPRKRRRPLALEDQLVLCHGFVPADRPVPPPVTTTTTRTTASGPKSDKGARIPKNEASQEPKKKTECTT